MLAVFLHFYSSSLFSNKSSSSHTVSKRMNKQILWATLINKKPQIRSALIQALTSIFLFQSEHEAYLPRRCTMHHHVSSGQGINQTMDEPSLIFGLVNTPLFFLGVAPTDQWDGFHMFDSRGWFLPTSLQF